MEGYTNKLEEKNLQIEYALSDSFPLLYANPTQMRQMGENLIDNAIKYTPSGGSIKIDGKV